MIKKVYNIFQYLFASKKNKINYLPYTIIEKRIIDQNILDLPSNVILTTYFSSKPDPQRDIFQNSDDFDYIKVFYESVVESNYTAVIFHDSLSPDFIEKYTNKNIKFVKCILGNFSLNDERYFIYREFLEKYPVEKIILSDANDVYFNKNTTFSFIKNGKLYIGRDENYIIGNNPWIRNKIRLLSENITIGLNKEFYTMPLLNAGVIGGDKKTLMFFLEKLTSLLFMNNNDNNNNMVCVNIVFYDFYWQPKMNYLKFKVIKNYYSKFLTIDTFHGKNYFVGAPFTSQFKKYQDPHTTNYHIYHR